VERKTKLSIAEREKQFIQDEIRRLSDLPQDQLLRVLEPWLSPIRDAFDVFIAFRRGLEQWLEEHRQEIVAVGDALKTVAVTLGQFAAESDAAAQRFRITLDKLKSMSELGWSFPTQLSLPELNELAELTDIASIDTYMVAKLEGSDPLFEHVEQRLLRDTRLQAFTMVLPQCFRSIRVGDYAVAMPNLISMLESVIIGINPPDLVASTKVGRALKDGKIAHQVKHDLLGAAIWLSLFTVVKEVWDNYPLSPPPTPPRLSRPAIQHGRLEPPNSKVETWRLLNTLETALALRNHLEGSASFQTRETKPDDRQLALEAFLRAGLSLPRGRCDGDKGVHEDSDGPPDG
jgi:hypothetical protein